MAEGFVRLDHGSFQCAGIERINELLFPGGQGIVVAPSAAISLASQ